MSSKVSLLTSSILRWDFAKVITEDAKLCAPLLKEHFTKVIFPSFQSYVQDVLGKEGREKASLLESKIWEESSSKKVEEIKYLYLNIFIETVLKFFQDSELKEISKKRREIERLELLKRFEIEIQRYEPIILNIIKKEFYEVDKGWMVEICNAARTNGVNLPD